MDVSAVSAVLPPRPYSLPGTPSSSCGVPVALPPRHFSPPPSNKTSRQTGPSDTRDTEMEPVLTLFS